MRLDGYEYDERLIFYVGDIMIVYHLGDEVARKSATFIRSRKGVKVHLCDT